MAEKIQIFMVALALLLMGCADQPGRDEYLEMTKSPLSDESRIIEKFSGYPVEKQIDVYVFSECCVEGNGMPFVRYLAINGETKLSNIIQRIDHNKNHLEKVYLLEAVELIDMNCHCVASNANYLRILENNESAIQKGDSEAMITAKTLYTKILLRIKNPGQ